MASTFSARLRLEKQGTFENNDTWGAILNAVCDRIDEAVAGMVSVDCGGGGTITLSTANGTSDQSRNAIIALYGSPGAGFNIVIPNVSKTYVISNGSTQIATFKTASPSATVTVNPGTRKFIFCDGGNSVGDCLLGSTVTDASSLPFSPAGNISSTNAQAAIQQLDSIKPNANGGVLTNATCNTQSAGNSSTLIANCAFVTAAIAAAGVGNSGFAAGTRIVFDMDVAPAGWVRDVNPYLNDRGVRIMSNGARTDISGIGGYSATMNYRSGEATALGVQHMPYHAHSGTTGFVTSDHAHNFNVVDLGLQTGSFNSRILAGGVWGGGSPIATSGITANHQHSFTTDGVGGGQGHAHNFDMRTHTRDLIICQKA